MYRGGVNEGNEERRQWMRASHKELSRLLLSLVFTVGFGVFVVLFVVRDLESGLRPALLFVIAGVFVHKAVSILLNVFW